MTKYIAFLRAINVGGHTVKMDHLRARFLRIQARQQHIRILRHRQIEGLPQRQDPDFAKQRKSGGEQAQ